MSRRWAALPALLLLLATTASAATPIEERMRDVERIRGLSFLHDVDTVAIDRSELPARLRAQMQKSIPYTFEEYEEILRALHLVEPTAPPQLIPSLLDLLQSQVLAYYDPHTHTYFSIRQLPSSVAGQDLISGPILEESVAVHELMHALQDQRFGIGRRDQELRRNSDASLAYHALVEGEATLVMMAWLLDKSGASLDAVLGSDAAMALLGGAAAADKAIDSAAPRFFVESLKFPYFEGIKLAIAAYRRGGWKELDRVHANPPNSTREVLHPAEYFARLDAPASRGASPARFTDDAPVPNVNVLTTEHLGQFHWAFLLGAPNARGWMDDRVTVTQNALCDETVLVETRWESPAHARTFRDAYVGFLQTRGVAPHVSLDGTSVNLAYGADAALVSRFVP